MQSPNLSIYQNIIHNRTYARNHGKRLEYYPETVDRYIDYLKTKVTDEFLLSELEISRDMIKRQEIMPSMRLFFSAGKAADSENAMAFNCKFQAITSLASFSDLLYSLLCTCGVGISVQKEYISGLPKVPELIEKSNDIIVVQDHRTGWAIAVNEYLNRVFKTGQSAKFDTSLVRDKGTPLVISGGYASGPEPLLELRTFIENLLINRQGLYLRSIDVFDIACMTAQCAVQGGVRRAAIITLFDDFDDEMLYAKTKENLVNNPHRYNSNNTMVWDGEHSKLDRAFEQTKVNGEPGFLFRKNMKIKMDSLGRTSIHGFGVNPCVTGNTLILTKDGYKPIESIVNKNVEVWNGFEWSKVTPFATGENDIYSIKFSNGMTIKCTPYHKWHTTSGIKETKDLNINDKLIKCDMPVIEFDKSFDIDYYTQGFYSADGNAGYGYSSVYEPKYSCIPRLKGTFSQPDKHKRVRWVHGDLIPKEFVPTGHSIESKLNWFAGLLDGDGNITRNPNSISIHLSSCNYKFLMKTLLLLNELGCQAKLNNMRDKCIRQMPDGKGGSAPYECNACYRLILNAVDVKKLIDLGLKCNRIDLTKEQIPNRNASRFITPISITKTNKTEQTYCMNEPKRHTFIANGVITGNCGEIILRPNAFCNLTETVLRPHHTLHMDMLKVRYSTILGLIQATFTDYGYIDEETKYNQETDPILGVSLTGLCDCPEYSTKSTYPERLAILRDVANKTVDELWQKVGLKTRPKAITCVKPSGTVSQLVNSSSGIHPRYAKHYIRRVLIGSDSHLYDKLAKSGIPYLEFDCIDGRIFEFPMKAPEESVVVSDVNAFAQLKYINNVNKYWCDHNASCTVYAKNNEWDEIKSLLKGDHNFISLSFLPYEVTADTSGFLYLPYEETTSEDYDRRKSIEDLVKWENIINDNTKETTNHVREFACAGGSCAI